MAEKGRIERKPEYDAEDWEAVGKLKEYVEEQGFTFEEREVRSYSEADCYTTWRRTYVYSVGFKKDIPGIVKLLKNLSIWCV